MEEETEKTPEATPEKPKKAKATLPTPESLIGSEVTLHDPSIIWDRKEGALLAINEDGSATVDMPGSGDKESWPVKLRLPMVCVYPKKKDKEGKKSLVEILCPPKKDTEKEATPS